MSEATQPDAAAAAPAGPISIADGAKALAERRASQGNDISAHASALGKRSAEARKERTSQAEPEPEVEDTTGEDVEDDAPDGTTLNDETADDESPDEAKTETEDEPDGSQTINLGDGVTATLDEIREGFMLKADHTRKTQALAEARKQFESTQTQKLAQLDEVLTVASALLPQAPDWVKLAEDDPIGYPKAQAQWMQQQAYINHVLQNAKQQRDDFVKTRTEAAKQTISEKYGANADTVIETVKARAEKLWNGDAQVLTQVLSDPTAIEQLDKARKWDELQAKKGDIKKAVADKPKVVKPGTKVSAGSASHAAVQSTQAKLKQSGSWKDAVALLRAQRQARVG